MAKKIRVGILFGGQSAEHEVSLRSARSIVQALDVAKYETVLLGIDKQGQWFLNEASQALLMGETAPALPTEHGLVPSHPLMTLTNRSEVGQLDVIFPVLHGPLGEDGTVQGLLKLARVPFVGADVLGSAVGMDKDVMKRLLRDAGLPIARFLTVRHFERKDLAFDQVVALLGTPIFVKPANLGSSVGVHRVATAEEFALALDDAFRYDQKILIEENIQGREIECSVLGNDFPRASVPGEIIPHHSFYSYDAKYLDDKGASLAIPAPLPPAVTAEVQALAIRTFQVLCCAGLARVDFFLRGERELFVNEINTLPGFTSISMYPKLWEASGLAYADLLDELIQLALERFAQEQKLKTDR